MNLKMRKCLISNKRILRFMGRTGQVRFTFHVSRFSLPGTKSGVGCSLAPSAGLGEGGL
jgi:hypothetical protein